MKVDFANLKYQHQIYKDEIEAAILRVARSCNFIMGKEVEELERNLEKFTGAKYAITCGCGTDALLLAMMALDIKPGDEIITTPFTFIATAETIAFLGAIPVFVDIDEKTYNIDTSQIETAVTPKTKAIIPVSLYGQPSDMGCIQSIAKKYHLKVIIDGAQSFGATYNSIYDSALGDISTTSFFPAKPLGCYGDGGACFTNDEALANKMKSLRVHGQTKPYYHRYIGIGGRLDTIQAAVLNVKLKYYKKDLALRQKVAKKYTGVLKSKLKTKVKKEYNILLPYVDERATSAWAQYSIRITPLTFSSQPSSSLRDKLKKSLEEKGIPTAIHYPKPLHLQECFSFLGYREGDFDIAEKVSKEIISLPMNPYVTDEEVEKIVTQILQ